MKWGMYDTQVDWQTIVNMGITLHHLLILFKFNLQIGKNLADDLIDWLFKAFQVSV